MSTPASSEAPLWTRRPLLTAVFIILFVSGLGFLLDKALVKEGVPRPDMMVLSNTLTGIVAGLLFYHMARHALLHHALIRERMRTVAELNHHIRNALQVIKFWGARNGSSIDAVQLQLIQDSVNRIEWALREVLPRYPMPAPMESAPPPEDSHVRDERVI